MKRTRATAAHTVSDDDDDSDDDDFAPSSDDDDDDGYESTDTEESSASESSEPDDDSKDETFVASASDDDDDGTDGEADEDELVSDNDEASSEQEAADAEELVSDHTSDEDAAEEDDEDDGSIDLGASDDEQSPAMVAMDALMTGANVTSIFAYTESVYGQYCQFGSAGNRMQAVIDLALHARQWTLVPTIESILTPCLFCSSQKPTTLLVQTPNGTSIGRIGIDCAVRFRFVTQLTNFEHALVRAVRMNTPRVRARLRARYAQVESAFVTLLDRINRDNGD